MKDENPTLESAMTKAKIWDQHAAVSPSGKAFAKGFDLAHAMVRDLAGRICFWSSSMERLYGWSRAEVLGCVSHDLLKTEFPKPLSEINAELLKVGYWDGELRHHTREGRTISVASHWALDRDEAGRIAWVIEVNGDISAQKAVEMELRESEARLRQVIDEAPLPIMVHADNGEVLQLSRAWTEASGYSRNEIPTVAAWTERAYGAAAPRARTAIHEAFEQGQGHYEGGEYTVRVADGSLHQWLFRAAPVGRDIGGRQLLVSMALDMTEIRRAEAAMTESEARYRAVVDTAVDPIIVINDLGTVQSFNRAAELLFGYTTAEVLGQNVSMLMPKMHGQAHDSYLERYRRTGERRIIGTGREVEACRRDGSVFPVHLSIAEWSLGGRRFFTGILRDLTEQKRQDAAIREAQKLDAIGKLASGIVHDFGNILTAIQMNLDCLRGRLKSESDEAALQNAMTEVELGSETVRSLLIFARRGSLETQIIDPGSKLEEMTGLLRQAIGVLSTVEIATPVPLWSIEVNANQFELALLNLAVNANDAMPDGGKFRVAAENVRLEGTPDGLTGDFVAISVTDTGSGMSPEIAAQATEPFFTTKEAGKGTGLGLSQVYGFAKRCNGTVALKSAVGQGTTVTIYIPKHAASGTNA